MCVAALSLGDGKVPLYAFGALSVASLAYAGHASSLHPAYYALLVSGFGGHLAWQVATVDLGSQKDCLRKFQSNSIAGALLFGALVVGGWMAAEEEGKKKAREKQPRTISLLLERSAS